MSEHQYYEFEAVDRRLTAAERAELRAISSRAEISATRFTNTYNFGDFRGDPAALMERYFDLHLYLANWGTRRLMVRLPRNAVDEAAILAALDGCEASSARVAGDSLVLDMEWQSDDWVEDFSRDDEEWLPALAPLREAVLDGDLRLVYLAWLMEASAGGLERSAIEPSAGLGPIDAAIEAFARFFRIDVDLLAAAAERSGRVAEPARDPAAEIVGLPVDEKDGWLRRLHAGEGGLGAAFRARLRPPPATEASASHAPRRSVEALLARAEVLAEERRAAQARADAEARQRAQAKAERQRQARIAALRARGEGAWREVETEIERRNAPGYDRAAALLVDLRALAEQEGALPAYEDRIAGIRARHGAKRKFIERLDR